MSEWDNNWYLIEGHQYLLKVFVYDRDKNIIQLTDNLVFKMEYRSDYFDTIKVNKI